jgi:kelch-like protein 10
MHDLKPGQRSSYGELKNAWRNFQDFRLDGHFCDVTLRTDDPNGRLFRAHRAVLCAVSNYFHALFLGCWRNTDKNVIELPGITDEMLDILLEYAYNREVNITGDNVHELLPAADQFNIEGIVFKCCKFLEESLNPDNCIGLRNYAKQYFCTKLEEASLSYILEHFESIISTASNGEHEEYNNLTCDELEELLAYDELNIRSEEHAFEAIIQWIQFDEKERIPYMTRLLAKLRVGLMDTEYFMVHVRNHEYVKACGEGIRPLIRDALQVLHRLEFDSSVDQSFNTFTRPRLPHQVLLAVGGWSGGSPTNSIEAYDSRADQWVNITAAFENFGRERPRAYHGVIYVDKNIFILGGFDGQNYFNTVRRLDLEKLECSEEPPMNNRRCYISSCALGGYIYAMGGMDGHTRLRAAERFSLADRQWEQIPDMNEKRSDASSCSCEILERIYCSGGFNGQECLFTAEFYCPTNNIWTQITPMRSRRSGVSIISTNGDVYAVGGFDGTSRLKTAEVYDPESNTWRALSNMINPRSNFGIEVLDGTVVTVGGFNGFQTTYNVEQYDIEADEWYEIQDMSIFRSALGCTVIKNIKMDILRKFCAPRNPLPLQHHIP